MKNMKKTVKRILAVICAVTLLISGLSATGMLKKTALADGARGTISMAEGIFGYIGYINMDYTGAPMDYKRGVDFLNEAFVDEYITFAGGMTANDLFEGKHQFYLATNGIVQFNWQNRVEAFEKGWNFSIAQGARIPYITTTEETAYVELDAEYTFEVKEGNSQYANIFQVTKHKVVEYGMNEAMVGNGLVDGTGTLLMLTGDSLKDYQTKYGPIQSDETYAELKNGRKKDYSSAMY